MKCEYPKCNNDAGTKRYCRRRCNVIHAIHRRRRARKLECVRYLGGQCIKCGYNKSLASLSFHHLRDKDGAISKMIANNVSWERIIQELDKCQLLCANCHGEEHETDEFGSVAKLVAAAVC